MKPQNYLPLILLLAVSCKPGGPAQGGMQMPPAQVTVATVQEQNIIEWETFTGRIEATEIVELRPRVSGYLTEVKFTAGSLVKKDDVLFVIDPRPLQAKVDQAQAEVQRTQAAANAAEREFARVKDLLAARALAPEQAEQREAMKLQSAAAVLGAQAALDAAVLDLEFTQVRAPISGRISRALITPGNYVSGLPGGASLLTTIVPVDPVYVYADIDETNLLRLQQLKRDNKLHTNGDNRVPVQLELSNETGFPHQGYIESFDNRLDAGTGSMILRAEFTNPDGALTPGLFARIRLPVTGSYQAFLIDEKSIMTDQANKFVLGVDEKNLSVYKPVVIGPVVDGKRIIRSGVQAGDRIIINGQARIQQPGMPVAPVAAEAPKQAAK